MARLSARLRERSELSARDVASMYALFERYYDGGSPEGFERDLADKTHVIELRHNDELRGFSTVSVFASEVGGQPFQAIFSGDTIVHHENWGEQALAHSFCRLAGEVKARAPDVALYWLLMSMGHRTYRYLHAFAREYFPSYAAPTPPAIAELLNALYRQRFGPYYDPASGIIRRAGETWAANRAE